MIDLIIAYLALIVVILLFIIVFLTFYLIYDRRKLEMKTDDSRRIVLPCLTLKSQDRSSGDHSNSASTRRTTKRLRYRVKFSKKKVSNKNYSICLI